MLSVVKVNAVIHVNWVYTRQKIGQFREDLLKGRINTVDLLVLTSLDQLLFLLKLYFSIFKQPILMRRSTVLSLPLQEEFPGMFTRGVVSE